MRTIGTWSWRHAAAESEPVEELGDRGAAMRAAKAAWLWRTQIVLLALKSLGGCALMIRPDHLMATKLSSCFACLDM